jgi:hypothetical protein
VVDNAGPSPERSPNSVTLAIRSSAFEPMRIASPAVSGVNTIPQLAYGVADGVSRLSHSIETSVPALTETLSAVSDPYVLSAVMVQVRAVSVVVSFLKVNL